MTIASMPNPIVAPHKRSDSLWELFDVILKYLRMEKMIKTNSYVELFLNIKVVPEVQDLTKTIYKKFGTKGFISPL